MYLAPLVILQNGRTLAGFDAAQQQSLALAFVNLNTETFHAYLIFLGLWCVLTGYLIFRSRFLAQVLGVLLVLEGNGWMLYLYPPMANAIYPVIATLAGLAELPLLLWFVIFGVNNQKWNQQAQNLSGQRLVGLGFSDFAYGRGEVGLNSLVLANNAGGTSTYSFCRTPYAT